MVRQHQTEAAFVETYRIQQSLGGAVMKVWCARGKTTQDGPFDLAHVIKFSIDGRLAKIGGGLAVARRRTRGRIYFADRDARQITYIQTAHVGGNVGRAWITSADVQRRREGVIAPIRSIVTRAAGSLKCLNSIWKQAARRSGVVDSSNTCDINRLGIENRLTASHRSPARMLRKFRPRAKRIENRRAEFLITANELTTRQLQRFDYMVHA